MHSILNAIWDCECMKRQCPAVIGVGRTTFGEHYEREPEKLGEEAVLKALDSAGMERRDLDACYCADYFLEITNKIGIAEGFLSELLELHIPMERMRSFSSALLNSCQAVQSGTYRSVLVVGTEKMTDRWDKIRDDLMLLEDPWSYHAGCTPEANHDLMLREYVKKYKLSGRPLEMFNTALAQISVKNHRYATKNKYAQFRREIKLEDVLKERLRAHKPLGVYDYAPVSDGAAALILTTSENAETAKSTPIYVLGSSSATDYVTFPSREQRTGFVASSMAVQRVQKTSKVKTSDIQIAELYDQSTLLEMVSLEDLGFSEKGKAWFDIYKSCESQKDFYEVDGKQLFVNTNGGLKADGNPLGATGGAQIFEIVSQLRGEAHGRQVKSDEDLRLGCSLELEGFGTKAYVHILGKECNE